MVIADRKGCGKVLTQILARNLFKTNHEISTTPEEDAFITKIIIDI